MKPTSIIAKRFARRAYTDRMAERQFVRAVLARKMTPEIEQRFNTGASQAQAAMDAPFLDRFRRRPEPVEA